MLGGGGFWPQAYTLSARRMAWVRSLAEYTYQKDLKWEQESHTQPGFVKNRQKVLHAVAM